MVYFKRLAYFNQQLIKVLNLISSYDALNRITGAVDNTGHYNLSNLSYDKNGNILTLQRQGHTNVDATLFGTMDNLVYTYQANSNQLAKVQDNGNGTYGFKDGANIATEYTYDVNGNLITDANKGITAVEYNHLNMPTKVTVTGTNAGVLDYKYSADGTKLQKKKTQGGVTTTTDYAGNYVYENNVLKQITQPEGYIEPEGSGWQYVYRLTDIWGNTRITFADDNNNGSVTSSEIRREQNYYPGGLEHKGYNSSMYGVKNNLKTYQKQEFTEDLGLNVHEWKYRMSDPATLRFWQIDPLAEDYYYNSTYAFAENKLGMGIELEGAEIWTWAQQKLVTNAAINPDGASAKVLNFLDQTAQVVEAGAEALGGIAHDLAPIRPADENDPQTIGEWWEGVKGTPEAISAIPGQLEDVYENGTIAEKTTATVGAIGLAVSVVKGKTPKRKQVTKVFSTRKRAKDARPKPRPAQKGQKKVTRQTRNKNGEGNKMKTDGGSQTPHYHDKNHNNKKKPNVHYRVGTKKIKPNE